MAKRRLKPSLYEAMRCSPAAEQPAPAKKAFRWWPSFSRPARSTEWDWEPRRRAAQSPPIEPPVAEPAALPPPPEPMALAPTTPPPAPEPLPEVAPESVNAWREPAAFESPLAAPPDSAAPDAEPAQIVRFDHGRIQLSLGAAGCMVAAAAVCLVGMIAYSAGRQSAKSPVRSTPALAMVAPSPADAPVKSQAPAAPPAADSPAWRPTAPPQDDEVRKLLEVPPARAMTAARTPVSAGAGDAPAAAAAEEPKPLQFLQIETFKFGRPERRADVLAELSDVQRFLSQHRIATLYRETPREFILLSASGFASTKEPAAQALKRQVEQAGRDYRKAGGRYEFKGCFFRAELVRSSQASGAGQE
ncbi:MAG: hypothetical protein U1A27_07770 [Phycisphaerae bacterium]